MEKKYVEKRAASYKLVQHRTVLQLYSQEDLNPAIFFAFVLVF